MLTREENERLTRVGPETPMGNLMRRYWMPALLSTELPEPDGPPVRVRLLGEDLVAFRATNGEIGLIDEYCPHRRASMWLGRNEDNGLRCVYHGWKFDVKGQCIDQMNEPRSFAHKIRTTSYLTVEFGGIIWTYMGPRELMPAEPKFEWTQAPEERRYVSKVLQESNWLQALEGGIDTSHFSILHRALKKNPSEEGIPLDSPAVKSAPKLELDKTSYGYRYFGIRQQEGNDLYVRAYHFIMPFTQLRPPGPGKDHVHGHFWVPVDDHHCMVWNFYRSYEGPIGSEAEAVDGGGGNDPEHIDAENNFLSIRRAHNDWLINRNVQRTDTFTGIKGINQQDRAVQESMGPIVDRTKEHLGPADKAISIARRLLLAATDAVERGEEPPGLQPEYWDLRPAESTFSAAEEWKEKIVPMMQVD